MFYSFSWRNRRQLLCHLEIMHRNWIMQVVFHAAFIIYTIEDNFSSWFRFTDSWRVIYNGTIKPLQQVIHMVMGSRYGIKPPSWRRPGTRQISYHLKLWITNWVLLARGVHVPLLLVIAIWGIKKGREICYLGVKGTKRANKCISWLWEKKMERPSWFCNALIFKRRYIYSSYKECKELGNRRYTKCTYPVKNSL